MELVLQFIDNIKFLLNHIPCFWVFISALIIFFAYNTLPLISYYILFLLAAIKYEIGDAAVLVVTVVFSLFIFKIIRRNLITKNLIILLGKLNLLPKISETEEIAITSGTVWVDGELFSGKPDFKKIFNLPYVKLSQEEKDFLKNEVEEVCNMCSDYQVQIERDLPAHVWQYLKDKKFFGMIIPKEYGGLGFSAYAHSCVIEKLASRSVTLAISVMVPNSLGPAELLLHYGLDKQRNYYLPRLATGEEIPCFALTEPGAGSDATSIESSGVLFKDEDGNIKIKLNWKKRYITLGAYATIIGVAFKLKDPNKILFTDEDIGITCALVPHNLPGVRQGRRHDPLCTPFVNSPLNGDDVIIDLDMVIGGQGGLGKGWKMLMECLAAGRGISLPSTSCGGSKLVSLVTNYYSIIRNQFGASIAKFEGVQEVLVNIFARTYASDALRKFTASAVDSGDKPAVVTAIAKYHATEIYRKNINDGMDILGGSGIIRGPRNLLANPYFSTPISITVEGANIMTRSLIHFGQGAVMCHPYSYKEMMALKNNDLKSFDLNFFSHIGHLFRNLTRSVLMSLTRGYIYKPFDFSLIAKYERKIVWMSASFAFLADVAIAKFGGKLKQKEMLNGRYGDALSSMYLSTCILKNYIENNNKEQEKELVEISLKEQMQQAQTAFDAIYQNIIECKLTRFFLLPIAYFTKFNAFDCPATDKLKIKLADKFYNDKSLIKNLTKGVFIPNDEKEQLKKFEIAIDMIKANEGIFAKLKLAIRNKKIKKDKIENILDLALKAEVITIEELNKMKEMYKIIYDSITVDEYSLEEYKNL